MLTATDPMGAVTLNAYDGQGNRTAVTRDYGRLNLTARFGYDGLGDVVSTTDPNGNTATGTFDADRRPLTVTAPATGGGILVTTLAYDANGQLLSTTQAAGGTLLASAATAYTLTGKAATSTDANGNLTRYGYDTADRLQTVTDPIGNVTAYVTDADNREILEVNGTSGTVQTWYAYGAGPNDVLNQVNIAAGTRSTLIPDLQGSVIGQLASSGTLTKVGYLPFGESSGTSTASSGFFYTGGRLDPETVGSASQPSGLYYLRARHYSQQWGRFLQADPTGYGAGPNLYTYAGNAPLDRVDPDGKDPVIGVAVGAISGAIYGALGAYNTPGRTWKSVLVGGAVGGISGGLVGALDLSFGVATIALESGLAAGVGDSEGQLITNALSGQPLKINLGSTAGAVIGGVVAGVGGTVLGGLAVKAGLSEVVGTAMGASIAGGPTTMLPTMGGALVDGFQEGSSGAQGGRYTVEFGPATVVTPSPLPNPAPAGTQINGSVDGK